MPYYAYSAYDDNINSRDAVIRGFVEAYYNRLYHKRKQNYSKERTQHIHFVSGSRVNVVCIPAMYDTDKFGLNPPPTIQPKVWC